MTLINIEDYLQAMQEISRLTFRCLIIYTKYRLIYTAFLLTVNECLILILKEYILFFRKNK